MQDPARASDAPSSFRAGSDPEGRGAERSSRVLFFAATIFASAFLIFLVQPMVAKRILPWFGGVPAVWTLCLAFYQTTLFLGYAYAHLLIRFVSPRLQLAIHAAAVGAAFLSLPVLPETPPVLASDADPTGTVLGILAGSVAAPFLVLASTGPLVQAWFARSHPTRSPYALYAVSNVGSFLALFAYPFALEPNLSLTRTSGVFSVGFAVTGLLVLACAWFARLGASSTPGPAPEATGAVRAPTGLLALLWLLLSGAAVVLLMGVTNKLCLDVASLPFLWIVPLATYLATFIVAFASERFYRRGLYAGLAAGAWLATVAMGDYQLIVYQVLAYCVLLFAAGMVLHGELYRSRPAPAWLTTFYLCVSAGGALGGLFIGLVAPVVFDDYYELQVGLILSVALFLVVCARDPESRLAWRGPRWRIGLAAAVAFAGLAGFLWQETRPRPLRLHQERSFFGVLKVNVVPDAGGQQRTLTNGTTVHGTQFGSRHLKRLPTAYFGRATGLGLTLTSRPAKEASRIGVIGLGVGTLAAYGRKNDVMRFYEIDPVVARLAGPEGYFTFLSDSPAQIEVVLGDARRSIEDELARGDRQNYDILVLDAFSSDSIPLHLMTREAFALYLDALAPDGLMVVHVSNRHFQLMGQVSKLAEAVGAHSLQIKTRPAPDLLSGLTDWVVVARDSDQLTRLQIRIEKRHRALDLPPDAILMRRGEEAGLERLPLWTDDYSDLLRVVRWR